MLGSARRVVPYRLLSLLVVAPLAVATAMVGGASTAQAATGDRVHVSGKTFTKASQSVTVSVRLRLLEHGTLRLKPPGGDSYVKVASGRGPRKLSYDLQLSCPTYAGSCKRDGRRVPARNGAWRVKFASKKLLPGGPEKASFSVAVPPARPTALTAKKANGNHVQVRWRRGAEPDLTSYLLTVAGERHRVSPADACGARHCAATVAGPGSGGSVGIRVEAVRDGAAGSGSLTSPASTTSVRLPASRPAGNGPGRRGGSGGPAGETGSHRGGAFPSPTLGSGGSGGGATGARLPRRGSLVPGNGTGPYPTFGKRPAVAPFTPVGHTSAQREPRIEPLGHGGLRGAAAVPVALGLAAALVVTHLWLWARSRSRSGPARS